MRFRYFIATLALLGVLDSRGELRGEDKNVDNLGTTTSQIRPARFHSLWVLTGFRQQTINNNIIGLENLFREFNESFRSINSRIPDGAEIISAPDEGTRGRLTGEVVSQSQFNAALEELEAKIEPGHVFFCYIMAHGTTDNGTLMLRFGPNLVPRSTIVDQLRAIQTRRRARLGVLITDNCSFATAQGSGESGLAQRTPSAIWRSLYFGHHEFVDFASTRGNETGFIVGGVSVFTAGFRDALNIRSLPEIDQLLGANPTEEQIARATLQFTNRLDERIIQDGIVSWEEFHSHLQEQITLNYSRQRLTLPEGNDVRMRMDNQPGQTLHPFSFGAIGHSPGPAP